MKNWIEVFLAALLCSGCVSVSTKKFREGYRDGLMEGGWVMMRNNRGCRETYTKFKAMDTAKFAPDQKPNENFIYRKGFKKGILEYIDTVCLDVEARKARLK